MSSPKPDWENYSSDFLKKITDIEKSYEREVWVPDTHRQREFIREEQEKLKQDVYREWKFQQQNIPPADPVHRLRKDMEKELKEIKDAIRKLGILFDSDVPSEEVLRRHKALRDAYLKYKMVEKLTLGNEQEGNDGGG